MARFQCSVCGYIYDETEGDPGTGLAPGTSFDRIPDGWVCPLCGADKSAFTLMEEESPAGQVEVSYENHEVGQQFSQLEHSALLSNLALASEKQYKMKEAGLFRLLASFFKGLAAVPENPGFDQLLVSVEDDLGYGFPKAREAAVSSGDRGALRALTWSEKVTRMQKSILTRYMKEGEAMLESAEIHVCTICGFIYTGDKLPDICPVCKVAHWKFEKIQGRA